MKVWMRAAVLLLSPYLLIVILMNGPATADHNKRFGADRVDFAGLFVSFDRLVYARHRAPARAIGHEGPMIVWPKPSVTQIELPKRPPHTFLRPPDRFETPEARCIRLMGPQWQAPKSPANYHWFTCRNGDDNELDEQPKPEPIPEPEPEPKREEKHDYPQGVD